MKQSKDRNKASDDVESVLQPIQLVSSNMEVVKPGKFPAGRTEIPFEFPLQAKGNKVLYETYHGVFVNIQVSERHTWPCPLP